MAFLLRALIKLMRWILVCIHNNNQIIIPISFSFLVSLAIAVNECVQNAVTSDKCADALPANYSFVSLPPSHSPIFNPFD